MRLLQLTGNIFSLTRQLKEGRDIFFASTQLRIRGQSILEALALAHYLL